MFKASEADQADTVYLPEILQAVKYYCFYSEKMGAGIWKPAGNFLVQRKRGPGIEAIASDSKVISLW